MSFTDTPEFRLDSQERDNAHPRFFIEPVQHLAKSAAEGRPIFEDKEMVEINVPGDLKNVWCGLVAEKHRQRWPRHYAAFKAGLEAPSGGTPLEAWPVIARSQVAEMKYMKVHFVEQLADLPDDLLFKVAPLNGKQLRDGAKRFLEAAAGAAPAEKLAAELAKRDDTIAEMKSAMEAMKAEIGRLQAGDQPPAAKRGSQA